jgi:hypothetical protein
LVGVNGAVQTDRAGNWQLDVEATPWRSTVILQQAGTLHVSGNVGGTSSRLTPAALNISWRDASVSDVLRLARNDDNGLRGSLDLSIDARKPTPSDSWDLQGRVALGRLHRWDLTFRPDDPSVNLLVHLGWRPETSEVELREVTVEGPKSNAHGSGRLVWNSKSELRPAKVPPSLFAVTSSQIDMGDLLAWVRAFRPGVAGDLLVRGVASAQVSISSWPLQVVSAVVSTDGADLLKTGRFRSAHMGPARFSYDRGVFSIPPVALSWGRWPGRPEGTMRLDASLKPALNETSTWHVAVAANQARDLIGATEAIGWSISNGWELAGPFACDLRWQGREPGRGSGRSLIWPKGLRSQPVGWLEFGAAGRPNGASLGAPFLNQPIAQIRARAELKPGSRHIALDSAQAFDTNWTGTFDSRDPSDEWEFAVTGDRLSAAALDQWLNPAGRESFLDRMLPFLNSQTPAAPEVLRASGRVTLDQLLLAPVTVDRLQGDLRIDGRRIQLENASGQFYGGQLEGSFDADLEAKPVYQTSVKFSRVDLAALTATSPKLAGLFAGLATGEISLGARGATHADLVASLACQGKADLAGPGLLTMDLGNFLGAPPNNANSTRFLAGAAEFACSERAVQFQKLTLTLSNRWLAGSGSVDFARNPDIVFQSMTAFSNQPVAEFRVNGTLANPQVTETQQPSVRARRVR